MLNLVQDVRSWLAEGKGVAIATVVRTWGSSPRKPGSIMAVADDGAMVGSISGGCIEGSVVAEALNCLHDSASRLISFHAADEDAWNVGLPCGGNIDVFVQPFDEEVHRCMLDHLESDEPFTYAVVVRGECTPVGAQAIVSKRGRSQSWMDPTLLEEALEVFAVRPEHEHAGIYEAMGHELFMYRHEARPTIVCVGAVHIASALVDLAKTLGYRTIVIDPRRAFATEERFSKADLVLASWPQEAFSQIDIDSHTAVCILSHDEKIDGPGLYEALRTRAFYIGCLGRPETLLERRRALEGMGVPAAEFARIYGPIGLHIGGRAPEDIALSTLAQISAVRYGRIGHASEMPGRTLDGFTEQAVAAIAAARPARR